MQKCSFRTLLSELSDFELVLKNYVKLKRIEQLQKTLPLIQGEYEQTY